MSSDSPRRVTIRHGDGRLLGISPAVFDTKLPGMEKSYAEQGFEIVAWTDGEAYTVGTPSPSEATTTSTPTSVLRRPAKPETSDSGE